MSLRKQATTGMVWTFAQQFGNQLIGFIISLVLARLLVPEEFGLIGMISIFVGVGRVLVDSGLTQSLVRSRKPNQVDFSTVFYFNLFASTIIYTIIFFAAPLVANFYNQEVLIGILRLYCLSFIIDAFSTVQKTRLTKRLDFKTQTIISIPSTIVGGITGIILAYSGFGVWSLVWSYLATSMVNSIQFWWYSKWSPSLVFNFQVFKEHFDFGYKLMFSAVLDKVFKNLYLIIIGKYFSAGQVGLYTRAETMKQLPVNNIANALNKVTYPLFAEIQEDDLRLKRVYKQMMQMVIFVIAPILIFLAVLAEPTFRFLFTEKWVPAVPYFQILCMTGILYPIHAYNLNVLKIKGRSDLFLKLAVIKKVLTVIGIIIGLQFGIFGLLYAQVFLSILAFFLNAFYTGRFINYSAWEQMRDILPIIIISTISGALVWFIDYKLVGKYDIVRMLTGSMVGILSYFAISYLMNISSLNDLKKIINRKQ